MPREITEAPLKDYENDSGRLLHDYEVPLRI